MKLIFCLQINTKVFYKVIVSLWVCIARHAQKSQNSNCNIFAVSQGKREGWNWFFASKWTSKFYSNWCYHFLYVWPSMPKLPKIISLLFLCNISKKKWMMKLIFCVKISMKVSYELMLWFLMGMVKHSQSFQNSKLAISLRYLKK